MNIIQTKNHRVEIYEISLFCFDSKIYIQTNGYDGLALIVRVNYEKKIVVLVTTQKAFLLSKLLWFFL